MAKSKPVPVTFARIISGIADYDKESIQPDSVAFARQIDFRTNPRRWTILPKTSKESGSIMTGLPMWGDRISTDSYIVDDGGSIYKRTNAGAVTLERNVSSSHGNGLRYFPEDGFMYYTLDKVIGRYGRIGSSPSYVDDFLGAQGGIPTNTYALDLEASSSQYATAADSASLSQVGDITLEGNWKPESLPAAATEVILASKWLEQGNQRSFKFSVNAVSGYFGDGGAGALTVAADATDTPVDSACSGTINTITLSATNASFAADKIVLVIQMQGTGAGTYQRNKIVSYSAGTMILEDGLNFSYSTGAQVLILTQYTNVTINSGKTLSVKAWNGTVGGILSFIANGTITVTGSISGDSRGFRGASQFNSHSSPLTGYCGEGTGGARDQQTESQQGNGAGGARVGADSAGGGGGNANAGSDGNWNVGGHGGYGGYAAGTADLTTIVMGGGGSSGCSDDSYGGAGGNGGAIIFLAGADIVITGSIHSAGGNGSAYGGDPWYSQACGGAGAGGSILLKAQTATLGAGLITAAAGTGGSQQYAQTGGNGSVGRIHLDYYSSYTGTTSPTLNVTQDNNLVTNLTYQLRLKVSSNGTNEETYAKALSSITVGVNGHYAVSWDASASTAEFMENGVSIGSTVGAFTAIYNSTALYTLGASFSGAGAAEKFIDGIIDDWRFWSVTRTATQIFNNKEIELAGTEAGLVAYHKLDNSASDATANANNLTLVNTPVYTVDVPFAAPTTRQDIDKEDTSTGQTYATPAAIDEGAAHRQTFIPAKDPQKSIGIYVNTVGTNCTWTITVHDPQNRLIASKTIANADMHTGHIEFEWSSVWRPVVGATYHFHVTTSNTTGAPKIVSGSADNLETGEFKSYYQFLVEDIYHPIEQVLNQLGIGNERYVATYDASTLTYNPHRLVFPAGWRVRCTAKWREYFAFGCWKGTSVSEYDHGMIFFWDGYSTTYNFFVEVPEGAVNAMLGDAGTLYFVAGYQGDILEYTGGDRATKVKRMPKITNDKYVEVLPGAMSMWRTLLHVGYGVTDSTDIEQGVYSWGRRNNQYLDSLSFDYKISTGTTQSTGMKIGLVMPVNKKLLVGWKDNVSFGLDSVDPAGAPYSEGSLEWLIRDEGGIWKEKKIDTLRADFEPLVSGHSMSLQYKLNRASFWSSASLENTVDKTKLRVQDKFTRHNEYQVRLNMMTSISTSPAALGVTMMEDDLTDEEVV